MRSNSSNAHSPHSSSSTKESPSKQEPGRDWKTLQRLFPYLWEYKWRVMAALSFMVGAKVANVGVPIVLKKLVDTLNTVTQTGAESGSKAVDTQTVNNALGTLD